MKKNGRCIVCRGALHELTTFSGMPASAQNMPDFSQLSQDRGLELTLAQCEHCGLVQFDTEPVWYYRDVIRAGGETRTMREIRHAEYRKLLGYMEQQGISGRKILEVGCGRGEFLKMWKDLDEESVQAVGIEHSQQLVETALAEGLQVFEGFAEEGYACPEAPFDAFVQFNFLEHQPDPVGMLKNIRSQLKDRAMGLITVPGLEYILNNDGYYELIRDHIAYYSEETLKYTLEAAGFRVLEMGWVNRDTIEAVVVSDADQAAALDPAFDGRYLDVASLKENYTQLCDTVEKLLQRLTAENRRLAVWGASHQGFTAVSTTQLSDHIPYIIDSAKFKQGKYAPASHVLIVPPDHYFVDPVDAILISAPGYTDEIAGIIRERYGSDVEILVLKSRTITSFEG